ncbi:MAG: membrane dipeptidase [Anaerolineales bacterium]|nr:membrane dipeptidase [Anaerolineales bacterium]
MLIIDGHLDIAYNALNYGRDFTLPLADLRARERGRSPNGVATVSLPTLQAGGVAVVFGTLFALPAASPLAETAVSTLTYRNATEAHHVASRQLDYYARLVDEENGRLRLLTDQKTLNEVLESHTSENPLLGILLLMEGADPVREPAELEMWVERGLRLVGPAWDDTRYAAGAWRRGGGLTQEGYALLEMMQTFGLGLDVSHLSERSFQQAVERYEGVVIASHSNVRALVPGERQLSDRQIQQLGERDGVIGIALCNAFLRAHHRLGEHKQLVTTDHVAAHVDHICQLLGDSRHVAIGSDLDGGFGAKDMPLELDSAADLGLIGKKLIEWGYGAEDVANVMSQNWLRTIQALLV